MELHEFTQTDVDDLQEMVREHSNNPALHILAQLLQENSELTIFVSE